MKTNSVKKSHSLNQKGQATIEAVLIMVVLVGIFQFVSNTFKEEDLVKEYVQRPWQSRVAGMIENGAWGTPDETNPLHPNRLARHSSIVGTDVQ